MPNGAVAPDSLTRFIESLQETIRRDGRTIGFYETRTRNALIDPLLRVLGWDGYSLVISEYKVIPGKRVDYALHWPNDRGRLIAFIEAKKMGEDLTDGDRDQVLNYASKRNVRHYCLTNGDRWELYEKGKPRPICTISIRNQQASECAHLLLTHFPTPPTLETAGIATPTEAPTSYPDAVILSGWDREVDVSKVLAYFLSFLFLSSVYTSFLNLWLNFNNTGLLRDIVYAAVGLGYTIVFVYALFFLQPDKALSRYLPLSKPINGEKKRLITWYWVAIAVVFGVGIGGSSTFLLMNSLNDLMSDLSDLNIWLPPLVLLLVYVLIFWVPPLLVRLSRNKKKSQ